MQETKSLTFSHWPATLRIRIIMFRIAYQLIFGQQNYFYLLFLYSLGSKKEDFIICTSSPNFRLLTKLKLFDLEFYQIFGMFLFSDNKCRLYMRLVNNFFEFLCCRQTWIRTWNKNGRTQWRWWNSITKLIKVSTWAN